MHISIFPRKELLIVIKKNDGICSIKISCWRPFFILRSVHILQFIVVFFFKNSPIKSKVTLNGIVTVTRKPKTDKTQIWRTIFYAFTYITQSLILIVLSTLFKFWDISIGMFYTRCFYGREICDRNFFISPGWCFIMYLIRCQYKMK